MFQFPNGSSSTWTPPLPAFFPSPGRSVDPLKKSASLSSPEATSDKLNSKCNNKIQKNEIRFGMRVIKS